MPCEGLKLTNPQSFWETSMHILGMMPGYGGEWPVDMVILTLMITEDPCCYCGISTHHHSSIINTFFQHEHFLPTQGCAQVHVVQRLLGSTVTHWFSMMAWLGLMTRLGFQLFDLTGFHLLASQQNFLANHPGSSRQKQSSPKLSEAVIYVPNRFNST